MGESCSEACLKNPLCEFTYEMEEYVCRSFTVNEKDGFWDIDLIYEDPYDGDYD